MTSPLNSEALVSDGFFRNADLWPESPALFIQERSYTYGQLAHKARQIAAQLPAQPFIGVYCSDDFFTYAAVLAVLLKGAAYVPLNPRLGQTHLQNIIDVSALKTIISRTFVEGFPVSLFLVPEENTNDPGTLNVDQPYAYLLFTSGSTGSPKGVPVKRSSLAHFLNYFSSAFGFSRQDRFLQAFELSWDVSVFCLFAAWNAGACVYVPEQGGIRSLHILDAIRRHQVTVVTLVPSVLQHFSRYLDEVSLPGVRYSFFAGEVLLPKFLQPWLLSASHSVHYNCYGPTETTIFASMYQIPAIPFPEERKIPIGRLLPGFDHLLLDPETGAAGSQFGFLCLSGPQVMDHYLGLPEDPSCFLRDGKKFYHTGDLVELTASGELIFRGRADSQVKISGYRVELGEIESFVAQQFDCDCVVKYQGEEARRQLLCFVNHHDRKAIGAALLARFPDHMQPEKLIFVKDFPLAHSGKVDLVKLMQMAGA